MNAISRKTTLAGVCIAALAMASAPAFAGQDRYARPGAVYDYAQVLSAEPIVRYVTVTTPVEECWNETREYAVDRYPSRAAGSTLIGAIIGGVIGHQIGSGRGNDAATAAGAVIGAAVGNNSARNAGPREVYSRPVRRCSTNYTSREEERIDGYNVTYRYHGQKYATRMPYDPGERLRIRVDVRPAE
ncbi:MAG TPA: glycine zipper 2TM domain-containing protein [Woeseiaceae bacterium]|nr:glycine zipper 2TM domain-containing protein [Woeseiaceae bacterium]